MKLETIAVHAGYRPEATTKSVAVPVFPLLPLPLPKNSDK